jgi:tetratricopeptide (TPR) repeat protein/tRNA A-37 threonylcarbamoyl transferase component Bud32/TolB-like protein
LTPPDDDAPQDDRPPADGTPEPELDTLLHGGPSPTGKDIKSTGTRPSTANKAQRSPSRPSRPDTLGRQAPPAFAPGQRLADRYQVVRFLAKGGMGEVYEVEDTDLGETVALKTLRPKHGRDDTAQQRFKREITLQRKIAHPNVCRIFDLGWHTPEDGESILFLTMELVDGRTLASRLRRSGPYKPDEALPLIRQMAGGLQAAHEAGIIHRDFKSANVMLVDGKAGEATRVVITDFGIARLSEGDEGASVTMAGEVIGTPAYMAPEQVQGGNITKAVDIYALGVEIYEMLTGRLPFQGESPFTTAVKRLTEDPESPRLHAPHLDPRWDEVILRCLERDPRERFANADDVVRALGGDPVTLGLRAAKRQRQRRTFLFAGLAALVVAGGLLAYRLGRGQAGGAVAIRRSVAVLGFKNLSQDPETAWLPAAFAEMLGSELAAGGQLRLVPGESVTRLKMELGFGEAEALSADTLARLRKRLGADAVVSGSCLALGEKGSRKLRLDLRVQDTASGESLAPVVEEGGEQSLLELVARAGSRLRGELGGASELSPQEKLEVATAQPPQPVVELYASGREKLHRGDALGARPLLEQAIALQPDYPLAHAALADAWTALGYDNRAADAAKRAFELRDHLPLAQRLAVEGSYYRSTRDFDKAIAALQELASRFPDDLEDGLRLAAVQVAAGRGKDAIAQLELMRRLPPPSGEDPRIDLEAADANDAISDFKAARAAALAGAERAKAAGSRLLLAEARLKESWALRNLGEQSAAKSAAEEARTLYGAAGERRGSAEAATLVAVLLRDGGDPRGAATLDEESLAVFRETGNQRSAARALNNIGKDLSLQGVLDQAAERFGEALAAVREIDDRPGLARQLNNLAELEALRGDLASARGHFGEALSVCRELGDRRICADVLRGDGDALLEQGDLQAARGRYQESLALAREIGHKRYTALALYGLAEADFLAGDLAKARAGHEEAEAMREDLGEAAHLAMSRVALGSLALEQRRLADAERLARAALASLAGQSTPDLEAQAQALLARVELASGADAREPLTALRRLAEVSQNPRLRIAAALAGAEAAHVDPSSRAAARLALERALEQARKNGLEVAGFDLRLALAELAGQPTAKTLAGEVAREAAARGLLLVSRRAEALAAAGPGS